MQTFVLLVLGVMLVVCLAALGFGKAAEWSDCDLDVERGDGGRPIQLARPGAVSSLSADDQITEEAVVWWDDPEWCWPESFTVTEVPVPRIILEQVI